MNLYGLTNMITEPTRLTTLLDPVLVSNSNILTDSEVVDIDRNISDHNVTLINIKIPHTIKKSLCEKYGYITVPTSQN